MATKLRAYYIGGNDGAWRRIDRWQMMEMPEAEYYGFLERNTMYLCKDTNSPKLTFNRLQKTFRYYPDGAPKDGDGNDGMTISHLLAEEIISDLELLRFELTDERRKDRKKYELTVRPSNGFREYRLEGNEEYFVGDVRIFFNEPYELALKWGGVLNIEIFATSRVKNAKTAFFEERREPLIEIKLSEKLMSPYKVSEITKEQEEDLRRHIYNAFSKKIYGRLLVSPSSEAYLADRTIAELKKRIEKLETENGCLRSKIENAKSGNAPLRLKDLFKRRVK